jgi:hypothetical protein
LAEQNFAQSSPELRTNILDYFDHRSSATSDARLKKGKDEERLQKELEQLRAAGGQEPGGSGNRSDSKSE